MKKVLLVVLAAVLVFALFACSDQAGQPAEEGDVVAGTNTKMETVSCEAFTCNLPEGWVSLPYEDMFAEEEGAINPNGLYLVKGDPEDEFAALSCGSLTITWSEPGTETLDISDMYDKVEDASMNIGGRDWEGFTGEIMEGYRNIVLVCDNDEGLWQVSGNMTGADDASSFDVESEDFLAILESITKN